MDVLSHIPRAAAQTLIIKILLTSVVVVAISEMAKRSVWLGAILAALPLTSLLALTWLWIDTHDGEKVAGFSMGVFWAVPPTLAFFPILACLLRAGWSFPASALGAAALTVGVYYLYYLGLKQLGVQL